MIQFSLIILWVLSLLSGILCAIVGFIGAGMGGGLSFYPIILMSSPFIVILLGIFILRAKNRAALLVYNAILLAPILQSLLFLMTG